MRNYSYLRVMGKAGGRFAAVWRFYRDGFRGMTWGRPLVWLILLKLFILFAVLRVFFFKPAMAGMTDREKSEAVGERLIQKTTNPTDTLNLLNP